MKIFNNGRMSAYLFFICMCVMNYVCKMYVRKCGIYVVCVGIYISFGTCTYICM